MIIGVYNEEASLEQVPLTAELQAWGYRIGGSAQRPHYTDPRLVYRVVWLDA